MPKLVKIIAKNTTLAGIEDRLSLNSEHLCPQDEAIFLIIASLASSGATKSLRAIHENFCQKAPGSRMNGNLRTARMLFTYVTYVEPASTSPEHWSINSGAQLNSSTNSVMTPSFKREQKQENLKCKRSKT